MSHICEKHFCLLPEVGIKAGTSPAQPLQSHFTRHTDSSSKTPCVVLHTHKNIMYWLRCHCTVYIGLFHENVCKFKMPKVDSWSMGQISLMSENAFSPNMTPSLFQTGLDPPPTQRNYDGEIRQQRDLVITFDWEVHFD